MRYEVVGGTINFALKNPRRVDPAQSKVPYPSDLIHPEALDVFLTAFVQAVKGKRPTTQRNNLSNFLRPLFNFARKYGSWPSRRAEWQPFVNGFFRFYLSDGSWSSAAAGTRIDYWTCFVNRRLKDLIAASAIPSDVAIPKFKLKQQVSASQDQPILGRLTTKKVLSSPTQKLVSEIDLTQSDAEYLDAIERDCRTKINVISQACDEHWEALRRDVATGASLAAQISDAEIEEAISSKHFSDQLRGGSPTPLAAPKHPQGHIWALALIRYFLSKGDTEKCITTQSLLESPFFKKQEFHKYQTFSDLTALRSEQYDQFACNASLYRFSGVLSALDVSAACCQLIIEHPRFTIDALRNAKIINPNGKWHILLTDDSSTSIFSVDKPRAGRRISTPLSPKARDLILTILERTAAVRAVLKRAKNNRWRYLFLGYRKSGHLGVVEPDLRLLTESAKAVCMTRLYPSLVQHGLGVGRFDFRRIRNTVGVLKWFETGSILQMSRFLGNSEQVALEHYVPPALLHAWNTRIIRGFQNMLIALAAHDEPYLLEVSDFTSIDALQTFVTQLLEQAKETRSPLGLKAIERFSTAPNPPEEEICADAVLNIHLSVQSIAYLHAFADFATKNLAKDANTPADGQPHSATKHLVKLSQLINHACEGKSVSDELSELIDLPRLRTVNARARELSNSMAQEITEMAARNKWAEP